MNNTRGVLVSFKARIAAAVALTIITLFSFHGAGAGADIGGARWLVYPGHDTVIPIDTTPDGSLQPLINEEAYYWNQAGGRIRIGQTQWHPNERCNQYDDMRIRFCYGLQGSSESATAYMVTAGPAITAGYVVISSAMLNTYVSQIRPLVGHELGHVLGLAHSARCSSLMNPTNACLFNNYGQPDAQDAADLRTMYP